MTKEHMGTKYREYQDLFKYLDKKCNFHEKKKGDPHSLTWVCFNDLRFTEQFCKKNKLDFIRVKYILEFFGGFCDCEVLFNVDREEHEKMWEDRGLMILEDMRK